jgi:3-oxoacyl-[acyl-carrier-protein] synthase II
VSPCLFFALQQICGGGILPPTVNLENPDPECDLDYCANTARDVKIDYALKNNFGFGGTNGSLVFRRI